jgi:hypothetical protein
LKRLYNLALGNFSLSANISPALSVCRSFHLLFPSMSSPDWRDNGYPCLSDMVKLKAQETSRTKSRSQILPQPDSAKAAGQHEGLVHRLHQQCPGESPGAPRTSSPGPAKRKPPRVMTPHCSNELSDIVSPSISNDLAPIAVIYVSKFSQDSL